VSYTPPPPPPPPPGGAYPPPGGGSQQYADLGPRIIAGLIDYVALSVLAAIVQVAISRPLGSLISLAGVAFGLYNAYLNGTTGQSIGKKMQNIKVVSMETGQPIGAGGGIARYFLHLIDALPCCVPGGYIYGLFIDKDKQTIADKIMKTVVVPA
jgi:uncharacterized RDD family membrane protein YckC